MQALESPWCEDSSNDSCKYTRNKFRHFVSPALAAFVKGEGAADSDSAATRGDTPEATPRLALPSRGIEREHLPQEEERPASSPSQGLEWREEDALLPIRRRVFALSRQVSLVRDWATAEAVRWESKVFAKNAAPSNSPDEEKTTQLLAPQRLHLKEWRELPSQFLKEFLLYRWLTRHLGDGRGVSARLIQRLAEGLQRHRARFDGEWRMDVGSDFFVFVRGGFAQVLRSEQNSHVPRIATTPSPFRGRQTEFPQSSTERRPVLPRTAR